MKKTGIVLYTIFALLFLGLPVFVLRMSSLAVSGYEDFSLRPALALAAGAILLCLIPRELPAAPEWLAALFWGWAAFRWRYGCFHSIERYMVMKYDFAAVLESARGVMQPKEAIFTHWAFYPRLLQIWDSHFGEFSYRQAVYFNLTVSALIVILVYLIARRIWRRQRVAMLAAAAACFWPSFSYYSSVISNEHPAMFFMLAASYAAVLLWQFAREKSVSRLPAPAFWAVFAGLAACAGLLAGFADLFKQFSPVFVTACFGAGLVFILMSASRGEAAKEESAPSAEGSAKTDMPRGRSAKAIGVAFGKGMQEHGDIRSEGIYRGQLMPTEEAPRAKSARERREIGKSVLKRLAALLLCSALMFGSASAIREFSLRWLEGYLGMPVARNAAAHFLWIGLNSRGSGMWTEEEGMQVYRLAERYGGDYDKVMAELMDMLREDYRQNREKLPETIRNKMEKDWAADTGISLWIKALYDEGAAWRDAHPDRVLDWNVSRAELDVFDFDPGDRITTLSAAFYMCVMGLTALGALLALFLRNPAEMYLRLVFYGYALLFLLSEAQGRYQVVLFPFFALLAAGAAELAGSLPFMRGRRGTVY